MLKNIGERMTKSNASGMNLNDLRNQDDVKLIDRVVSNDKNAIDQLFREYKNMILKISRRYLNIDNSAEQRIELGNRGLLIAAKRFHNTRGINFISYGYWWVQESFHNSI